MLAGTVLVGVSYEFARSNLIEDLSDSSRRRAVDNAARFSEVLSDDPANLRSPCPQSLVP